LWLSVLADDHRVRVEITGDGGADTIPPMASGVLDEHGTGLVIVRGLSDRCGSSQDQRGRTAACFQIDGR
jgi:hypothetical protein